MTPSDDIRDLLGRYASGSLSAQEQERLFDAALDDQDLFDQLAREQELKQMLDQPGARDRMIRALEPPKRKSAWIFGVAATVAFSVALMVVMLRPAPKPPQVAMSNAPTTTTTAPPVQATPPAQPEPTPPPVIEPSAPAVAVPAEPAKAKSVSERREAPAGRARVDEASADQPSKDARKQNELKKEAEPERDAVSPRAAAPAPAPQLAADASQAQQQSGVVGGGPRQSQTQSRVSLSGAAGLLDMKTGAFGIHYSVETPGHLSIIPAVDGYLFAKTNDGTVLFGPKISAAGITVDIPLSDAVTSVIVTFSRTSAPVQTAPAMRTTPTGTAEGSPSLAIQVKIKP
jgi:hypothetical protein